MFSPFKLSELFFLWINPIIALPKTRDISLEDIQKHCPEKPDLDRKGKIFKENLKKSFFYALFRTYPIKWSILFLTLIYVRFSEIVFPFFIQKLVEGFKEGSPSSTLMLSVTGFLMLTAWIRSHSNRLMFNFTWEIPGLLRCVLLKHYLKIPSDPQNSSSLLNLSNYDADKPGVLGFAADVLLLPLACLAQIYFLYRYVGVSAFAGVFILFFALLFSKKLEKICDGIFLEISNLTKERTQKLWESLASHRVIKAFGWETFFMNRIQTIRQKEIIQLQKAMNITTYYKILSLVAPQFIGSLMIAWGIWKGQSLPPESLFPVLLIINLLGGYFTVLPDLFRMVSEALVSQRRINDFLSIKESHPIYEDKILLNNASFKWRDTPLNQDKVLKAINFEPQLGEYIAIVGSVGAGKSAFLKALLGHLEKSEGESKQPKDIAYLPQTPWNFNGSIKDNITFFQPFDAELYEKVLFATSLKEDLQIFSREDLTEIGDRGITLSGGQKQRLGLARTIYVSLIKKIPIILMDDILSAVDVNVAKHIGTHALRSLLSHTTRILVTHSLEEAQYADKIYLLKNGELLLQDKETFLKNKNIKVQDLKEPILRTSPEIISSGSTTSASVQWIKPEKLLGNENLWQQIHHYFKQVFPSLIVIIALYPLPIIINFSSQTLLAWKLQTGSLRSGVFIFLFLNIVLGLLDSYRLIHLYKKGFEVGNLYFSKLLQKVFRAPVSFIDENPLGRIINRFSTDMTTVDQTLPNALGETFRSFSLLILSLFALVIASPLIILFFIPLFYYYYGYYQKGRKGSRQLRSLSAIYRSPWTSLLGEVPQGLPVIQSLHAEEEITHCYTRFVTHHVQVGYALLESNVAFVFRTSIVGYLGIGALFLTTQISPFYSSFLIFASLNSLFSFLNQLGMVIRNLRFLEMSGNSLDRIQEYSSIPWEDPQFEKSSELSLPENASINLNHISFKYRQEFSNVLEDASLSIPAGSWNGLIGRTGSGKSSLFNILLGFYPIYKGEIFIHDIPFKEIPLGDLRKYFSYIPQEPFLFEGSLKENLDPYHELSTDKMKTLLDECHIALDLDFHLSSSGQNISVGQRQLIAMIRIFLRNSPIVLLDEATSSLDYQTDVLMQKLLKKYLKDKTVITIAHRLDTLKDFSFVYQCVQGKYIPYSQNIT